MDIRLKFEKTGKIIYLGHLDLMRLFQKALIRAHLPLKYTGGFHPHPIMAFAQPLSVGVVSLGEYFDVTLAGEINPEEAMENINSQLPEGVRVADIMILPEKSANAMSSVAAARYEVRPVDKEGLEYSEVASAVDSLLARNEIIHTRERKGKLVTRDIRPSILSMSVDEDFCFHLFLRASSADNLQAGVPVELVFESLGIIRDVRITRLELYMEKDGEYLPLINR